MKQQKSFPSSSENKTELKLFLVSRWKSHYCINEIEDNLTYDTFCVIFQPNDKSQLVPEVLCNNEEAGTHMYLHAKQLSDTNI